MKWLILLSSTLLITLAPYHLSAQQSLTQNNNLEPPTTPTSTQKRHKITVNVTSMADLKVVEKQRIEQGEIISDRTTQRQKLQAKKRQLEISLSQLSLLIREGCEELRFAGTVFTQSALPKARSLGDLHSPISNLRGQTGVGLWKNSKAIPPWEYRKQKP
ncbi:MAG: hypothetical protein AB4041_19315 [Microcystaceae cyanobacterium]